MDSKIFIVIIVALLGAIVSFISFQYKMRREAREKMNVSLYHLLEIWSFIGLIKFLISSSYKETLVERLKHKYPDENFTKEMEEDIIKGMSQSVPFYINMLNPSGNSYSEKYSHSVKELAKVHPMLAFNLSNNQFLIKLLDELDSTMEDNEENKLLKENLTRLFYEESFYELEKDLLILSFKSGVLNYLSTRRYINRIKEKHNKVPTEAIDEYIEKVIDPLVR